jgi:hypothetical protein
MFCLYATLERLRSPRELAFRLSQQVLGLASFGLSAPRFTGNVQSLPVSAPLEVDAEALRELTESILRHEFPIFDRVIQTGDVIDWRFDYHNGIGTPAVWFRKIPFLDFQRSGDHKYVWELNRHQHLVVLAQAWAITHDPRIPVEIAAQIESWDRQNPFLRSVNWASALEIAMRALSWLWVLHFCGSALPSETRELLGTLLLRHGVAISENLSTYFAPNTHILGEGVAMHALGMALGRKGWVGLGAGIVDRELRAQVLDDGFHFELSSYYHLYALDMFMFHYQLRGRPDHFDPVLRKMARVAAALQSSDGLFPLIGDDDGGRFFHPYGCRRAFGRTTLANYEGPWGDLWEHFASSGVSVFRRGSAHITFDCGPFSRGGAGHSHADALSLTLRAHGRDVLVDPGTFTYVADPAARDWFRGTAAHSTLRLSGKDQADPVNPFRWENKPRVRRLEGDEWRAAGECSYREWVHVRLVDWSSPGTLLVEDTVAGPRGAGTLEQNWHSALEIRQIAPHRFAVGDAVIEIDSRLRPVIHEAFRSEVFGSREKSFILHCTGDTPATVPLKTAIEVVE